MGIVILWKFKFLIESVFQGDKLNEKLLILTNQQELFNSLKKNCFFKINV